MNKPDDLYHTTMTPGIKPGTADQRVVELQTLEQLRSAAIDVIRRCDLALYGRADKTIPQRRR